MKAGQVYKMREGTIYVVVDDYGVLRPMLLESKTDLYFHFNMSKEAARGAFGSFYGGDLLLFENVTDYYKSLVAKEGKDGNA